MLICLVWDTTQTRKGKKSLSSVMLPQHELRDILPKEEGEEWEERKVRGEKGIGRGEGTGGGGRGGRG